MSCGKAMSSCEYSEASDFVNAVQQKDLIENTASN